MKFVGLVSGGKDSIFNILHSIRQGHELIALANLYPSSGKDEIDSFMYQTVGHDVVSLYDKCTGLPLYRREISGLSENVQLEYSRTANDETEDLLELLKEVKENHPDVEGVSSGAILSNYQRNRVEYCCSKLGLISLAWLWQMDQSELMGQMCDVESMDARIIKVAAFGLNIKHLGMKLQEIYPHLLSLNDKFGIHVCGEGGEFETLVLDAPFFTEGYLELVSQEMVDHGSEVWFLKMKVRFVERKKAVDDFSTVVAPPLLHGPFVEYPVDKFVSTQKPVHNQVLPLNLQSDEDHVFISNISSQGETLERQVLDVFVALSTQLQKHGIEFSNIQSSILLLQSMKDFAAINTIYSSYFTTPLPPARICVETNLARSTKLQLSVVALKSSKSGVHIQSRSYWAPCNIGPYSQAVSDSEGVTMISGQIPLVPASMAPSPQELEIGLSLQHFDSVKKLVAANKDQAVICFIVDTAYIQSVLQCWKSYGGDEKRLIIVQVSSLPRGVGVEWGGYSTKGQDGFLEVEFFEQTINTSDDYHYTVFHNPTQPIAIDIPFCSVPVLSVWKCATQVHAAAIKRYLL
ncbi:unnamed protein product [Kuraishia capsulata CBS 1993]|uniref:Diphthine--ammonia ligase n=1 Tax=Kuraishia capsulata CBS 1993 TaxID=1382522 RepID=W6MHN5_9ASCO|nr:uncharacterized protein KUCA_T00001250001 [Kuraishia capsulata CBS 1993]CDK25283.1 unnamed protein product [Kuraishia capsulata CBS 1993]